jgi:hypothetical protein
MPIAKRSQQRIIAYKVIRTILSRFLKTSTWIAPRQHTTANLLNTSLIRDLLSVQYPRLAETELNLFGRDRITSAVPTFYVQLCRLVVDP